VADTSTIAAPEPVLSVSGLHVRLPENGDRVFGIEDIGFDVRAGETRCIVGESGSGKSLTAQSILGLLPKRFEKPRGRILFEGTNLLELGAEALRRIRGSGIGMIFQEPMTALNPVWKVGAQLDEVLLTHRTMTRAERADRIGAIMDEVNLPETDLLGRYPHELSGGQRQRVMIAMALILDPRLLIADEPTTALDVTTQAQILQLIRKLQDRHGTGVLFITHDFGVVSDIADDVTVMQGGRVVESGPAAEVLRAPRHDYTRTLLEAVPKGRFGTPRVTEGAPVVLRVKQLSKTYRPVGLSLRRKAGFKALHDVSLEIRGDEIVGLVGESGSGKSTVARCVSRLIEPDGGLIELNGVDISRLRGRELRMMRRNVQVVFQDPYSSLNPRRTVGGLIAQGLIKLRHRQGRGPAESRRHAADRQPGAIGRVALSIRFLGRSAPANRHCACTRAGPETADRRRGRFGARRVDSGAGAEADPTGARHARAGRAVHYP
jgi:peptide/nickel transport system ATP-binding protein